MPLTSLQDTGGGRDEKKIYNMSNCNKIPCYKNTENKENDLPGWYRVG